MAIVGVSAVSLVGSNHGLSVLGAVVVMSAVAIVVVVEAVIVTTITIHNFYHPPEVGWIPIQVVIPTITVGVIHPFRGEMRSPVKPKRCVEFDPGFKGSTNCTSPFLANHLVVAAAVVVY